MELMITQIDVKINNTIPFTDYLDIQKRKSVKVRDIVKGRRQFNPVIEIKNMIKITIERMLYEKYNSNENVMYDEYDIDENELD